ncbi:SIMPL domain-containing protein [Aureimonas leprariae]|uniref:SIMPL domain-containing protein n=1 Tax=Plantimonas leprariae TaxID=2615207 RepID=A0A7V7PP78_9HYPH|nr:SIMPL domain-containing protein [Aureimonas leprariae]KAB0679756.1 SIMPL domain-containing protein [Aureimonas leprariae]
MVFRSAAFAVALVVLPAAALAQSAPPSPPPPPREIVVSGSGEASAAPDLATASFQVVRNAKTAREALTENNKAMTAVIAGLKELGIEGRDLQTSGFGISPQYRYDNDNDGRQDPPELVGYEARNGVSVRIRDMGKIGEILDRAISLGVNSGGDIGFTIDDLAKLRIEAKRKAVQDATETATALAEAAGVKLGRVIRLEASEGFSPPPVPMPMARKAMAMDAAPVVPVEGGESSVQANVTMVFAIEP